MIALDAMGGDFGPPVVIEAASMAQKESKQTLNFKIFGDSKQIEAELKKFPDLKKHVEIIHTDKVIANDEKPALALRNGRGSSMRLAIDSVKAGEAAAIVSAGNTGALMATSKMVFKCLPGIHRPAIASVFPTKGEDTVMLDLGANLHCDPEILVQFALMGAVYARTVRGIQTPLVGILNVGSESVKGPDNVRTAASILSQVQFPGKFHGFVEGDDIPAGKIHVIVTDGFTGNIALKVAEGVADLVSLTIKDAFKSSLLAKFGGLLSMGALKRAKKKMDPRYYNGGMFLGLGGICVKSHGGMDSYGFSRAILVAADLVEQGYNDKVALELEKLMGQESFVSFDMASHSAS
jgi:glycerol-3-phosphate acyltransferase PlsX